MNKHSLLIPAGSWEGNAQLQHCPPPPKPRIQERLGRGKPPVERSIPHVIHSPRSCWFITNEPFSICSPPTADRPRGRSTTRRTRGEWAGRQTSLALRLLLPQESTPARNSKCRPAVLCIPPPLRPRSSCHGGAGVLKGLAAAVGISSLMERVRGKKRGAGFSSHFLCPENDYGRKEATPALAREAVLGLPAAPSLRLQPGL